MAYSSESFCNKGKSVALTTSPTDHSNNMQARVRVNKRPVGNVSGLAETSSVAGIRLRVITLANNDNSISNPPTALTNIALLKPGKRLRTRTLQIPTKNGPSNMPRDKRTPATHAVDLQSAMLASEAPANEASTTKP